MPTLSASDLLDEELSESAKPSFTSVGDYFKGKKIIVERNGFVAIESVTEREAVDILNSIMAIASLAGVKTSPVRYSNLYQVEFSSDKSVIKSRWSTLNTDSRDVPIWVGW